MTVAGSVLFLLGAIGAGVTVPRLERAGSGRLIPVVLVPFGAAIGSGAAMMRGWDPVGSGIAGAIALPVFAIVSRLIEVRRGRGRDHEDTTW